MRRTIGALLVLVASSSPALPSPKIAVSREAKAATACVYRALNADRTLRPVSAYAIDSFRTAVEVHLPTPNGIRVTQIVLTKAGDIRYSGMTQTQESLEAVGRELDALGHVYALVEQGCHIQPAIDNLLPRAKARKDWQTLNLAE